MVFNWLDYLAWGIALLFLISEILERIGIIDKILKRIVRGPYTYADQALIEAADNCRKHFYLITSESDFIHEPWGNDLLKKLNILKNKLNYEVKIMISGDLDAPEVKESIEQFTKIGFKDEEMVKGDEKATLLYYYIVGGLQAAAMNENICLVKIDYKKEIKIRNKKDEEKWGKWFKIYTSSLPGKKEYKYIKRDIVRKYKDSYIKELVEGYFHGFKSH